MRDALADNPTRSFVLIDDDWSSARFFIRQLKWSAIETANVVVKWFNSAEGGLAWLNNVLSIEENSSNPDIVVVDLKNSSSANLNFVEDAVALLNEAPVKLVVFTATCDAETKKWLINAGAYTVMERHSDPSKYSNQLAGMLRLSAQTANAA